MHHQHPEGDLLRYWDEQFWRWDGAAYRHFTTPDLRAWLADWLGEEYEKVYARDLMLAGMARGGGEGGEAKKPHLRPVTCKLVHDVVQAAAGLTRLSAADCPAMPHWFGEAPWPAQEVLALADRLVHLPSWVAGAGAAAQMAPTPRFFSTIALDYGWQDDPPTPVEWHKFLKQLWPNDQASIDTLAEWFGYCLLPDTSRQKILALIGPRRSGKGTIGRILRRLIGPANACGPTLSSMAGPFGLQPLIGKTVGVISDARLSGRTDRATIVERLLSISGEDEFTVDRKYLPSWTGKLPTRLVLISNEPPKLADTSGALVGRMLLLRLTRSFYGSEDLELYDKLCGELSGILHWAIAGWKRLAANKHFIQPARGLDLIESMEEVGSPTGRFVAECCKTGTGAEFEVKVDDLFAWWKSWCASKNIDHVGDTPSFGRNLRIVVPHLTTPVVKSKDPETGKDRYERKFVGIRKKTKDEMKDEP
jgi:putative DNA primase/helicase